MKKLLTDPIWTDLSLMLARVALGLMFLISGWTKMTQVGFSSFVNGPFKQLTPAWLPESVATPLGYAIPALELVCGLALTLGLFSRIAAGILFLLLVSFTIALMTAYGFRGGEDKMAFHPNLVFIPLAMILTVVGPGRMSLDPLYFQKAPSK